MNIIKLEKEMYDEFIEALRISFAKDYIPLGITKENAKSNGSFFERNHLYNYINKGLDFFVVLEKNVVIGGIGLLNESTYIKIKKIFVLPNHQKRGIGKKLIDFSEHYTKLASKNSIRLGMIRENENLHRFYINNGFVDKKNSHNKKMNLNITFMEKTI